MVANASKRDRLSVPFFLGVGAFGLLVVFLIVGNIIRPRKAFTFSGTVKSLDLTTAGIREISEGPHGSKDPFAVIPVRDILVSGTTLELSTKISPNFRVSPSHANHISYWTFDDAVPLLLTLPSSGRISIFGPTTSTLSTCAPFVDEAIPKKISQVFVFNTPTKKPLWELGPPSPKNVSKFNMSTYGYGEGNFSDFMKRGIELEKVYGHYFEHRRWPTQICASLAPLLGYSVRIPPKGTLALVDYVPWLGICCATKDAPYSLEVPASSIDLSEAEGELLLAGKSLGQIGGQFEIDEAEGELHVRITSDGERLTAKVTGSARSLVLGGEQIILPWFTEVTNKYPVGISVLTALISGFLGAIIATRGHVVETWLGRSSDGKGEGRSRTRVGPKKR